MPLLQLDSVRQSYFRGTAELKVLRGVSLEVDRGHLVAIHGDRRAGKTTLLRVAAGYEPVQAGTVRFDGADLRDLGIRGRASLYSSGIAWINHTGPRSDDLTASEYVGLPLRTAGARAARRRANETLARVDVGNCGAHRWTELTDSERVRVAIAHGLVRRPAMLIVDDVALGLGVTERDSLIGLLRSAAEDGGLAVLAAVSDLTYALAGCAVQTLSRGRLLGPSGVGVPRAEGSVVALRPPTAREGPNGS